MRFLKLLLPSLVIASLPTPLLAGTTLSGVEGMTSTVLQEGQSSFSGLGLRANFKSDQLVKGFDFTAGIEYWRNNSTVQVQPFKIRSERRDATMAFHGRYFFRHETITPYVGAGFGIHFLTSEVSAPSLGVPHAEESVIKGGLSALTGLSFALSGKFKNFMELEYHHVTDFRQLKLNWGITYSP